MALKKIRGVKVEPLVLPTYLALVEASVGSPVFRTFFAKVNGKKTDILRGGRVSCAFFVTSILKVFNLVQEVQVTNHRAVRDLEESGWYRIPRPRKGCVVFWKEKDVDPARYREDKGTYQPKVKHIGFYIGDGMCVSNGGDQSQVPWKHPLAYRPVDQCLWHPALEPGFENPSRKSPRRQPGIFWQPNA